MPIYGSTFRGRNSRSGILKLQILQNNCMYVIYMYICWFVPPISLHTWPLNVFIQDNIFYVLCNMEVAHIFPMLSTWRKKTGTLILINWVNLFLAALFHSMAEGWISSEVIIFNISVFFFFNPGTFNVHQKYLHLIKNKMFVLFKLKSNQRKWDDQLLHVNVCTL